MKNEWKEAVLDAMVINCSLPEGCIDDPRKAVSHLIKTEVNMALDPLISKAAQDLVDMGRKS